MSLFERIQKKIIIESSSDTTGQNKKNKEKKLKKEIGQRRTAQDRQQQLFSRQYDAYDDGDLGNPTQSKTQTTTQKTTSKNRAPRKGVDYFFDPDKAKADREKLISKRKEYGIDRKGNISDAGVERYARKTKQLSSGSNLPVNITQADKDLAKKRLTNKYGRNLPRKRPSNAKSLEQIKKEIDSRPPDGRTSKTKTKVKTPPPYKRIETKVTDKEIQDLIKKGKEAIPKKSTKVTAGKIANVDKAIKNLDDLIIGEKPGEKAFIKKALRKQQRVVTKKITTPSKKEIEQSQKILDKTQTKPKVTKVKGNLFDPTGKLADQTKKAKQSFNQFMSKLKTKYPKPKLSLYDPLKTKINVEPLKPLRTFVKPSTTKTVTKSKTLLPKLMKAARKNPKLAVGVGLLSLGTYGAIKNRKKATVKNKNKNLTPIPTKKDEIITRPVSKTFKLVGDESRKPIPPKKM